MGFPPKIITLIMQCITMVSFQLLVNGIPTNSFRPTRGIYQGDPLSPFLFSLCTEGLSVLLRKAASDNCLKGLRMGQTGPEITHLLFADDSLMFTRAKTEDDIKLREVIQNYEAASG